VSAYKAEEEGAVGPIVDETALLAVKMAASVPPEDFDCLGRLIVPQFLRWKIYKAALNPKLFYSDERWTE